MSNMGKDYLPSGEADKIESAASAWLERRERDDWNEAARAELDRWLAQSPSHMVAYLRIQDVWDRAGRLTVLSRPVRLATPAPSRWRLPFAFRVAASLVVVGGVATALNAYVATPRYQTYMTTVGGREKLSLGDGSSIELNTDTVLRIVNDSNERKVFLDKGEAYFDIRHNPAHPFLVVAGGHRVRDIGTKFVVRNDPGRLEVRLMQGSAELESLSGDKQSHTLKPGDIAVAQDGKTVLSKKSTVDLAGQLGWRRGLLEFHHTSLADAAAEFNRYSRDRIVIADPVAAKKPINGALPVGDLDEFERMARNFFGLHAARRGDTVVFSQ
jgi:transmembrane sensor